MPKSISNCTPVSNSQLTEMQTQQLIDDLAQAESNRRSTTQRNIITKHIDYNLLLNYIVCAISFSCANTVLFGRRLHFKPNRRPSSTGVPRGIRFSTISSFISALRTASGCFSLGTPFPLFLLLKFKSFCSSYPLASSTTTPNLILRVTLSIGMETRCLVSDRVRRRRI